MENFIYNLLNELNINYKRLEHEAIASVKNCVELEGQQVKNLVLKAKKTNKLYLVILHDKKMVNLTSLALALNEKRLSFASEETLKELLHCEKGTVTPFGLLFDKENLIEVIIDSKIDTKTTVGFHPFVNTVTLNIQFDDFARFLDYANHKFRIIEFDGEYEIG